MQHLFHVNDSSAQLDLLSINVQRLTVTKQSAYSI